MRALFAGRLVVALLLAYVLCEPLLPQLWFELRRFGGVLAGITSTERERLLSYPFFRVLTHMNEHVPPDGKVFSLRPADWYYATVPMVSYLDPETVDAYRQARPEDMLKELRRLGVTHVYVPAYSIPPLYNSALMPLLGQATYSRPVYSDRFYSLFSLSDHPRKLQPTGRWNLTPSVYQWTGSSELDLRGLRRICRKRDIVVASDAPQETIRTCGFYPRHRAIYLSGRGPLGTTQPDAATFARLTEERTYRYKARLSGRGFVRVLLIERMGDAEKPALSVELVDEGAVSEGQRDYARIFRVAPTSTHARIGFMLDGRSRIAIHKVTLEALHD